MTEERLCEIEARANAATPGPWVATDISMRPGYTALWVVHGPSSAEDDATFIAAARQDVPDLVAEVRRFRDENTRLRAQVDAAVGIQLEGPGGNWRAARMLNDRWLAFPLGSSGDPRQGMADFENAQRGIDNALAGLREYFEREYAYLLGLSQDNEEAYLRLEEETANV